MKKEIQLVCLSVLLSLIYYVNQVGSVVIKYLGLAV